MICKSNALVVGLITLVNLIIALFHPVLIFTTRAINPSSPVNHAVSSYSFEAALCGMAST